MLHQQILSFSNLRLRLGRGQVNLKAGSHSGLTGHFNPARMLLHDAVHHRQPQTCAFAYLLGGEEWFK